MKLPNDKIGLTMVREAISGKSNNIGVLITQSAIGGVFGRAFFIEDNAIANNGRVDGLMIPGAKPLWNIYSNRIPAEWIIDEGRLNLQLKRYPNPINGGYNYDIADFAGYNHDASIPEFTVHNSYTSVDGSLTISFSLDFKEMKFPESVTHILAEVQVGENKKDILAPLNAIISESELISAFECSFTNVYETNGAVQLWCSDSTGAKICTMGEPLNADWSTSESKKIFSVSKITRYVQVSRSLGSDAGDVLILGRKFGTDGSGNDSYYTPSMINGGAWEIKAELMFGSYSYASFDIYMTGNINQSPIDILVGRYGCAIGENFQIINLGDVSFGTQVQTGGQVGYMVKNIELS